jgi:hypothetical protein
MTKTKKIERCGSCGGTVFVAAIDNDGKPYRGCARCVVVVDRKNEPVTVDKVSGRGPRTAKAPHVVMGNNSLRCLNCGHELKLEMPVSINVLIGMGEGYTKDHIDCQPSPAGEARYAYTTIEEWRRGWDTGASSLAIFAVMTGTYLHNPSIPYDPDDFGRCYRLLKLMPEWRARLHEMNRYPEWVPLIANWPELEALYVEELPNRTAPKLYDRMSELLGFGHDSKRGARISNP